MTAAEFIAIVDRLFATATHWLEESKRDSSSVYREVPSTWVIGVTFEDQFLIATPFHVPDGSLVPPAPLPVCWLTWETHRTADELRDVLGQALAVLMHELGMELPR